MKKCLQFFRKNVATRLEWNSFVQKGYEGDDIIGILVRTFPTNVPVIIVGNDGDLFQLLSVDRPSVSYYSIKMGTLITAEDVRNKIGYSTKKVIAAKCIWGCTSDEIKGVKGIGEKRVLSFLTDPYSEYTETILKRMDDTVLPNKELVSLPLEGTKVPKLKPFSMNMRGFVSVCKELGFIGLLNDKRKYEKMFCS